MRIPIQLQPMSTRLIEYALDNYAEKIAVLEAVESSPSVEQVLDLLTARDVVYALVRNRTRNFSKNPAIISELDRRLKSKSVMIAQVANLDELRSSFHPPIEAWWWFFETPSQRYWWDRFDRYWNAASILLLIVSIYILFDIATKLLSGEPDPVSSLVTTLQTALSTLAISAILTRDGREKIDQLLRRFNIPVHFHQESKLLITIALLVLLLGFYHMLPAISNIYNNLGSNAYADGRLLTAQTLYKRAVKFSPDNLKSHYNLGLIYEDIDDLNDALNEYKIVTQGNDLRGHNNLGRLYVLTKDYSKAAHILSRGLYLIDSNDFLILSEAGDDSTQAMKYSLLKNLGWTRLEQQRYQEAQILLEEAIKLVESFSNQALITNTASAYCLLAQVLEKQNENSKALVNWENCVRYANPLNPDEDTWLPEARKRLSPPLPES